jgi:hypothetical protein
MVSLLDGWVETLESSCPRDWARFQEIAPGIHRVPGAARELLRARLEHGAYDLLQLAWSGGRDVPEAAQLLELFKGKFAAAIGRGRWVLRGVPRGAYEAVTIPALLVTTEAFQHIRCGDRWELAGTTFYAVHVEDAVVEQLPPSPNQPLRDQQQATDDQIHLEIDAEYTDCEKTGREPPNVKKIGTPVRDRLRAKGRCATLTRIRGFARDKRYISRRRRPGPTIAAEKGKRC